MSKVKVLVTSYIVILLKGGGSIREYLLLVELLSTAVVLEDDGHCEREGWTKHAGRSFRSLCLIPKYLLNSQSQNIQVARDEQINIPFRAGNTDSQTTHKDIALPLLEGQAGHGPLQKNPPSEAHSARALGAYPNPLLLKVTAPGAWFKGVVLSPLINHGCVLGVTCNTPNRVPSPIPSKSQVRSHLNGLDLIMGDLPASKREHFSAEETVSPQARAHHLVYSCFAPTYVGACCYLDSAHLK